MAMATAVAITLHQRRAKREKREKHEKRKVDIYIKKNGYDREAKKKKKEIKK